MHMHAHHLKKCTGVIRRKLLDAAGSTSDTKANVLMLSTARRSDVQLTTREDWLVEQYSNSL